MMKKILLTLFLFLGLFSNTIAQTDSIPINNPITPRERQSNKLVQNESFDKLVFQHLNFLIVGENTPSQGISTEIKDSNTSLTVKGLLFQNNNFLTTVDGTFAVEEGVYFFDEKGGSKTSKFTMNFFFPYGGSRKYDNSAYSNQTNRALIRNMILEREINKSSKQKLDELFAIILRTGIPALSPEEINDTSLNIRDTRLRNATMITQDIKLAEQLKKYQTIIINKEILKKYALELPYNTRASSNEKFTIKHTTVSKRSFTDKILFRKKDETTVNYEYEINDRIKLDGKKVDEFVNIDLLKLIDLYEAAIKESNTVKDSISSKEINYAEAHWNSKRIKYFNISPFYKRESKTIFKNPENPTNFDNLFDDIKGDLFGLSAGWNYNYQKKSGNFFYGRVQGSLSRISNFSSFSIERTFRFEEEEDISIGSEGATVANYKEKKAFLDLENQDYSYGFGRSIMGEVYYSFYNGLGLFGQVGYNNLGFKEEKNAKNKETYPFRLGVLFNLKAKDKVKNITTLQVFIDRGDASIDPTPNDTSKADDWRFGFKLGLPINLKKQL